MEKRGLLRILGERGIDPTELEGSVRRVILTTYAVLLGLALATAFRDVLGISGNYVAEPGVLIPKAVAWIASGGAILATTFLFVGAAHARTRWRYAIIAPILFAIAVALAGGPHGLPIALPLSTRIAFLSPIAFLISCAVIVAFGPKLHTRSMLFCIAGLLVGLEGVSIILSATLWSSYAPTALFFAMVIAACCLFPALVVLGWDFGEIAADGAAAALLRLDFRSETMQRLCRLGLIATLAFVAITLHFADGYATQGGVALIGIWVAGLSLAVSAGVMLARVRRPDLLVGHLGYRSVFLLAVVLAVFYGAGTAWQVPDDRFFQFNHGHKLSFVLPKSMQEEIGARWWRQDSMAKNFRDTRLMFYTGGKLPNLVVAAVTHQRFRALNDPMPTLNELVGGKALEPMDANFSQPDKMGWRTSVIETQHKQTGHKLIFLVYKRIVDTQTLGTDVDWYIICGGTPANFAKTKAACQIPKASFTATIKSRPSRPAALAIDLVMFACAASLFFVGLIFADKLVGPIVDLSFWALFLIALNGIGGYIFGGLDDVVFNIHLGTDLYVAILATAALASVTLEFWHSAWIGAFEVSGLRRLSTRLNIALCILGVALYLYDVAASRSAHSQVIRGVVICLALTWELATAGSTLNKSSHYVFPRSSRILLFVGYLVLVATCVFLFGDLDAIYGGYKLEAIDTEELVAGGMVLLGAAYLIASTLRTLPSLKYPLVTGNPNPPQPNPMH